MPPISRPMRTAGSLMSNRMSRSELLLTSTLKAANSQRREDRGPIA